MTETPVLSILIVTWNVREDVLSCLRSIADDADAPEHEVILVDNASTDGTARAVSEQFPHVRTIVNRSNVGFPRANNQALACARGRYVLYLNPDTEVRPSTLAACVAELDANADVGVVGCRLESPDGSIQFEGARNTYRFRHLAFELLYLHMIFPRSRIFGDHRIGAWDHRGARDVEAVSGAFMMVRRELATMLGGLPDDVFMYHEDLSFCLRVLRTGSRIRYLGDVSIMHQGGRSSGRSSARFGLLEVESKYRYVEEADGRVWAVAARAMLALRSLLRLLICLAGVLLPRRWKQRYPRVFDWRTHLLQLWWCVAPASALRLAPGAEVWLATGSARLETVL